MSNMSIEVLCPHFAPDTAPTGTVMTSIVEQWVDLGHRVDIVTSIPWYSDHAIDEGWSRRPVQREHTEWGSITRVFPFPSDKNNLFARALGFGGFTGLSTVAGLASSRDIDVVMAMSPPLTLGMAGWSLAKRRRAPLVFNVQDVFPDVAVELGALTGRRTIRALERLERRTYLMADAVTVLSEDLRVNVATKIAASEGRGADPAKVQVIPNFVDVGRFDVSVRSSGYREEFGLDDRTVVMYAGNVGHSQSLDMVVETARRMRRRQEVVFVINGNGVARAGLERAATDLDNLVFIDFQAPERLPEVLAAGDVHLVPLKAGLARSSVPSKFYSILAAARPVVVAVDKGSELADVVEQHDLGEAVEPDDVDAFVAAIETLVDSPSARSKSGHNGRKFVESWLSPAGVADAYIELFTRLREQRSSTGSRGFEPARGRS